ncbi:MAG: tRNA pseudouridine(38-40) synthase TruA [Cyanobacteria bacterium]|nr:tRNA pseudouridine(38-40) synthase TruA [Cyanobacteriota bacterium]
MRTALLIEYDGSAFHGAQFQSQQGTVLPTVQQALEDGLKQLGLQTGKVHFSGRTDAGVHAHGQVGHVDIYPATQGENPLRHIIDLPTAINAVLPKAASVRGCVSLANTQSDTLGFHSQRSATHRWYQYRILNSRTRSALLPAHGAWVSKPLDEVAMNTAAQALIGTHDFTSFKCPDSTVENDDCTVYRAKWSREGDWIIMDIVANRFLYKMVRNLTGFFMSVGHHKPGIGPETLSEVLASKDRQVAARWSSNAPACGLSLMAVNYPSDLHPFREDPWVQSLITSLIGSQPQLQSEPCVSSPLNPQTESIIDENICRKAS